MMMLENDNIHIQSHNVDIAIWQLGMNIIVEALMLFACRTVLPTSRPLKFDLCNFCYF